MLFFGAIVVVLAGAQFKINGQIIESPADIVADHPQHLAAGAGLPGAARS